MDNQTGQTEQRDKSRKKPLVIAAFGAMAVALGVCIGLLLTRPAAEVPEETRSALDRGFVDDNNADSIMSEADDKVAEGMFECSMTTTWTFEDGTAVSPNAYVENVEANRHTIYFDVVEDATGETLYSSPLIPVGSELKNIKLEKELPAGTHEATVMYTLVDENNEEISSVGFRITILINN